jgi:hypothetical protein
VGPNDKNGSMVSIKQFIQESASIERNRNQFSNNRMGAESLIIVAEAAQLREPEQRGSLPNNDELMKKNIKNQ